MSSSSSNTTKKVIIGCVVAGAAALAGGLLYYKVLRKEEVEEDLVFNSPSEKESKEPVAASKTSDTTLDALADELLKGDASSAPGAQVSKSEEVKVFADVGLKCKVPDGWEIALEDGPTPQIQAVKLFPKDLTEEERMDPAAFGKHPNIMVMVEDTVEAMSAQDYKDKSKEMAVRSGQGMMQITRDEAVKTGPFQFHLEGAQPIPDPTQGRIMQIKFLNLLTMNGSCGYAVQYIATEETFDQHLSFVLDWASSIEIQDLEPREKSLIEYTNSAHQVQVNVPWAWCVMKQNRDVGEGRSLVVSFKTGGMHLLPTEPPISRRGAQPVTDEHIESFLKDLNSSSEVQEEGTVCHCKYTSDDKEMVLYTTPVFALEIKPDGKQHGQNLSTIMEVLGTLKTVTPESGSIKYINKHYRFSFEVAGDSSLAEFKFGTTAAMYSPVPQPDDMEVSIPIFKVFVNKEEEHYPDLKAVEVKLRKACEPTQPMQDFKYETYSGREWLSFTTTFMDGPYGPYGPREEYKSRVYICLRGEESFMLKWEIAANEWRRYERSLDALMDSFVVLE